MLSLSSSEGLSVVSVILWGWRPLPCRLRGDVRITFCQSLPFSLRKHLLVRAGGVGERLRGHSVCILQWFFLQRKRSPEPSPWEKQTKTKQNKCKEPGKIGLLPLEFLLALGASLNVGVSKNLLSSRNVSHLPSSQARRHGGEGRGWTVEEGRGMWACSEKLLQLWPQLLELNP